MKKRIFVDTNILLDVLLEREGFYYDALKIWANAELGKVEAKIGVRRHWQMTTLSHWQHSLISPQNGVV